MNGTFPRIPAERPFRKKNGFSLIEIMAAVFVLGLGIGGALLALRIGFGMVETARDQTLAAQLLQSQIETLRLKNWAELSALPREESFEIESNFDESVQNRFHCVRRIEEVRAGSQMKQVTLTVTWTTTNGVQRERQYYTRISRNGLNDYYYRSM
jgi:prepilin-type N-terminal cleavage/methylation domain-containing protein